MLATGWQGQVCILEAEATPVTPGGEEHPARGPHQKRQPGIQQPGPVRNSEPTAQHSAMRKAFQY